MIGTLWLTGSSCVDNLTIFPLAGPATRFATRFATRRASKETKSSDNLHQNSTICPARKWCCYSAHIAYIFCGMSMRSFRRIFWLKGMAPAIALLYSLGSFSHNGLHLHADLSHAHDDSSEHHHHLALHSHSDLIATKPVGTQIESNAKEHQHPVGEIQLAAFSQALNKRQRSLESKDVGSKPFIEASFLQPFLSEPMAVFLSRDESPPETIFHSVSSGRSPPLA